MFDASFAMHRPIGGELSTENDNREEKVRWKETGNPRPTERVVEGLRRRNACHVDYAHPVDRYGKAETAKMAPRVDGRESTTVLRATGKLPGLAFPFFAPLRFLLFFLSAVYPSLPQPTIHVHQYAHLLFFSLLFSFVRLSLNHSANLAS